MGSPKAERARKTTPKSAQKRTVASPTPALDRIRELRAALHNDTISKPEFRELIHREEQKNIWAARVFLRSVARDLIPDAATLARKGRSRLLQVIGNILLGSEALEAKTEVPPIIEVVHNVARPQRWTEEDARQAEENYKRKTGEWPQLDAPDAGPL
ncbi:MAG: hypothetical protein ACYDCD_07460 [Candidatus Acidiferrales bacterium]